MTHELDAYTARRSAPLVEVLDLDGKVIAWAVDAATAQALVALLNLAHASGLIDLNHEDAE